MPASNTAVPESEVQIDSALELAGTYREKFGTHWTTPIERTANS